MPASHLSCHPIVNDGKVWKGEICDDFCVYMCLQILVPGRGVCRIGMDIACM